MKYLSVLLVSAIIFPSCGNKEKVYYKTGEVKTEFYKNAEGFKHGEIINYYRNGNIASKGYCINDTFEGVYEEYYPNTQIKIKTNLLKGKQEGEYIEYFENGNVNVKGYYKAGKQHGLFSFYYLNGKPKLISHRKDNIPLYSTSGTSRNRTRDSGGNRTLLYP